MAQKHVLIICGEASGDLHAANLIADIKKISPQIRFSAVGGQLTEEAGASVFYDIKGISAIGFFDALQKLPKFFALKKLVLQKIKQDKPDAVVFVDFSGFNLRLAKNINKTIPSIYYISPQIWASRPGRVRTIKKYIDKILVFFKFEEEFYKKYGVTASFVGHPLLDIVRTKMDRQEFLSRLSLSTDKTTVALLPGSRNTEIKNILPVMLEACLLISKKIPHTQFIIAKSTQVDWEVYRRLIKGLDISLAIAENKTYECLAAADFALVCSGTATLETAIMERPFCVIYKMSLLNYLLYRWQVKIPYIGMVNIVAGKKIIPEFIQFGARAEKIADLAIKTLQNPAEIQRIKNELTRAKSLLGEKGASSRAARIIVAEITSLAGY